MLRLLLASTLLMMGSHAMAGVYNLVPFDSVFAVVTHKGGIAARLAHNHLVVADKVEAKISVTDPIEKSTFSVKIPVSSLVVDNEVHQTQHFPALKSMGILSEPLSVPSAGDLVKVKEAMFSAEQLDAKKFPFVEAQIVKTYISPSVIGTVQFSHQSIVAVTIRGVTIEKTVPMALVVTNAFVNAATVIKCKFSEFGIEPYSAAWGAVKVKDEFEIYVKLRALPE